MRVCGATPDYTGALMRGVGGQVCKLDAEHSGDHRDGACRWPQDGAHTKVSLTDDQFSTLVNAIHVAAHKFEENAKYLRMGTPIPPLYEEVARTFDKQAKEAWALSYLFDAAERVDITS